MSSGTTMQTQKSVNLQTPLNNGCKITKHMYPQNSSESDFVHLKLPLSTLATLSAAKMLGRLKGLQILLGYLNFPALHPLPCEILGETLPLPPRAPPPRAPLLGWTGRPGLPAAAGRGRQAPSGRERVRPASSGTRPRGS